MSGDAALTSTLDSLVGPGKKFATVEDLAKGKAEADTYIDNLKSQLEILKNQVSGQSNVNQQALDSILAEIKNTNNKTTNNSSTQNDTKHDPGLTEADVLRLVEAVHAKERVQRVQNETLAELGRVYGDKSEAFLADIASKTGFSVDQLKSLAGTNPVAFKKLTDLGVRTSPATSVQGTVNSGSLGNRAVTTGGAGEVRNRAWYEAKKNEMGLEKFINDSALQAQMHRDLREDYWE